MYYRFPLSLRLVEEMLLERGIVVSYETIRRWAKKFGPSYARRLRCKQQCLDDIWHLDEVRITIAGRKYWLWRAVDQDGYVLDEIVQERRNTKAAMRLLTRLLKKQATAPKRMITDKLRSYGAARRQVITVNAVLPGVTETDMNAEWLAAPDARAGPEALSVFSRVGKPEDVADVITFLASNDARWTTGQMIDATGGARI